VAPRAYLGFFDSASSATAAARLGGNLRVKLADVFAAYRAERAVAQDCKVVVEALLVVFDRGVGLLALWRTWCSMECSNASPNVETLAGRSNGLAPSYPSSFHFDKVRCSVLRLSLKPSAVITSRSI
jgi:hypothetical protein